MENGFYTMNGYTHNQTGLSASAEDYLEMICRLSEPDRVLRINELAAALHVKPSSASKMAVNLKDAGFITFQKYGYIAVTERGRLTGGYLLYRHSVVHSFLCMLNGTDDELEQAEKIEHYLNARTVENMDIILKKKRSL